MNNPHRAEMPAPALGGSWRLNPDGTRERIPEDGEAPAAPVSPAAPASDEAAFGARHSEEG